MHNLQLTLPRIDAGPPGSGSNAAYRFWLRTRRRITGFQGILERRRFKDVRARFYDTLWRDAAADVGASIELMPNGMFRIARRGRSTFVDQSTLMLDSALADRLMLNKAITYSWISAMGLRTVSRARFGLENFETAERFLADTDGLVVVKPADGTGCGQGVTTGIADSAGLVAAANNAASFHSQLLVERQLAGASYRLLFLNGHFLDAVRRDPPVVLGDGRSTIRQLARHENERRRFGANITALSPLVMDLESRHTLAEAGLTLSSVPKVGEEVQVKLAVNENAAAQNHIVREEVNPGIIAASERVARKLRMGVAGFDITATDISAPPDHADTVFNEINIGAGLHHHYLVSNPSRIANVASCILEHIFETGHGAIDL